MYFKAIMNSLLMYRLQFDVLTLAVISFSLWKINNGVKYCIVTHFSATFKVKKCLIV